MANAGGVIIVIMNASKIIATRFIESHPNRF